ncbi:hypothetical protein NDU88_003822 [Pleurodeles waltl]|uniref:Uncharacterized protein n=1 Tax=Pleurodeles waltl TaxID=8319 RepID=A0AAV7PJA3_PLEWA|nr:hypothetical protein NDU88_003822 [Pleurodeles waltl]
MDLPPSPEAVDCWRGRQGFPALGGSVHHEIHQMSNYGVNKSRPTGTAERQDGAWAEEQQNPGRGHIATPGVASSGLSRAGDDQGLGLLNCRPPRCAMKSDPMGGDPCAAGA